MEQFKEMLREVLQEELAPRLDRLENRMSSMENRISSMEDQVSSMQDQVSSMKVQLDRIERAQTEDVVAMLKLIDNKMTTRLDRHEHQISILNDRLLTVEADVRKLLLT